MSTGAIDAASLDGFIAAYQSVEPLKLGELWALPLMLRLALIENLRRVAVRISAARRDRDLASDWAERMLSVVEQKPTDLILVLADMARANPPLSGAFVAEFTRHLQGQNPNFALANSWLEHRLADQGLTTEQLMRAEGQAQAADQVSMGNSINSLRFLNSNDWRQFVSQHSLVEQTLADDPAGIYAQMDFGTRDRYRHAVEGISRRSRSSEYEVARKAVQLAENEGREKPDRPRRHTSAITWSIAAARCWSDSRKCGFLRRVMVDKLRRQFPLTCYLSAHRLGDARGHVPVYANGRSSTGRLAGSCCCWPFRRLSAPQSWGGVDELAGHAIASARIRCRGWISNMAFPPSTARWWWCPPMLTNPAGIERLLETA